MLTVAVSVLAALGADDMRALLSGHESRTDSLFLGQDRNTRLDMMDYYDAGTGTYSRDSRFGSDIRIEVLEDRHVRFGSGSSVTVDAYLLTPGADSLLVTVVSFPVGNGDAGVHVTDVATGRTVQQITPSYADWMVRDALKTVSEAALAAAVPFVTADATVDTAANVITLRNTAAVVPGLDETFVAAFRPEITYRWNGKQFVMSK